MGLSIHYHGSFKRDASLSEMIEEVKDLAEIYKWKYSIFETEFEAKALGKVSYNDNIYGICFSPPECEPVWLSFLSNGRMSGPHHLQFWGHSNDSEKKKYLYMLSTKTQYAGMEVHKVIIHFIRHISKKYLDHFELSDEGQYWETGDENVLAANFKLYTDLIENFASGLEEIPPKKGETMEQYLQRVFEAVHKRRKK